MICKWLKKFKKKKPVTMPPAKTMNNPRHYIIAWGELGVEEVPGTGSNPRILEYHDTCGGYNEDEIPWCSSFVNWCLKSAGKEGTWKATARSFMQWGHPVESPEYGDIVVFWRGSKDGWRGHVAFWAGDRGERVRVLGGNQYDKVCYKEYSKNYLLGYRRAR